MMIKALLYVLLVYVPVAVLGKTGDYELAFYVFASMAIAAFFGWQIGDSNASEE